MNKKIIPIKGMHCRSCEILVEDELSKIHGVEQVEVNQKKGQAIVCSNGYIDQLVIEQAVINAGYSLGFDEKKQWFSHKINNYVEVLIYGIGLVFIYFIANDLGLFNFVASTSNNFASLPVVFLVGITAGLSTCMALVGGLVLGASARFAEAHPTATSLQKFKPHVFFNLGRILSYFILGGIIGYAGSFFQLSPTTLGLLTIAVGAIMLLLGLQLTELFPRLNGINITLPKGIARLLGIQEHAKKEYSHKNSMIMGALTFFLPCGFTQAMQLFAISSGSPITGALTMGIFALGTTPGLLSVGGFTAFIKGNFAKMFFKFAGVVVVVLAFFNIFNGYNLTGLNIDVLSAFNKGVITQANDPNVTIKNGVQIVKMTQGASGYSPNSFTIKKGIPVKWIINSINSFTCAASIVSAELGVRQGLKEGENIIEFTPTEIGPIRFSCSMGMYTGVFNVVDDSASNLQPAAQVAANAAQALPASCGGSGGGCGCGVKVQKQAAIDADKTPPVKAIQKDSIQLIKATYSVSEDIIPKKFTVKSGSPVRFEIDVKENGAGCMGSIALPGLSQKIDVFTQGKTTVFEFTPSKTGSYTITCGMGVPRGTIIVV
ncbi:MAG: sulfite exporter TauE/SafE family protein [bacterium]|nr:sulfite exporter TauE/SafE family protein [bacterium]